MSQMNKRSNLVVGTITKIIEGIAVPYIVFSVKQPKQVVKRLNGESVTLKRSNWTDREPPKVGFDAVLQNVLHKNDGWRAHRGYFWRLD